ncbi:MAG: MFS transporter [Chloroflexota bacterium]
MDADALPTTEGARGDGGIAATPLLSQRQRWAYLCCNFAMGTFAAFNNFTLTLWLSGFTSSYLIIGLMGNSRSLEGAVVSPIMGAWSDRVWLGWLGRRRPFVLIGGLLSAATLALTPTIGRISLPGWMGWLGPGVLQLGPPIFAIFLFTMAFHVMDDVHKALLADITSPDERNGLSALSVTVEMASQVLILLLGFLLWNDRVTDLAFIVAGAVMSLALLGTVLGVREPAPADWSMRRRMESASDGVAISARSLLRQYRGATALCLAAFCYWAGVMATMPLISIYTRDILGADVGEAQLLPGLMLLTTTLLAIPMGWLGDVIGKRPVMVLGYVLMIVTAIAAMIVSTIPEGVGLFLFAGVGNSAVMVMTLPLLADLVPRDRIGAAAGLLAAAGSIAAPFSSLVAGALSDVYGPRAIFVVMAVMVAAALVFIRGAQNNDGGG